MLNAFLLSRLQLQLDPPTFAHIRPADGLCRPVGSSRYVTAACRPFNARGGLWKALGSAGEWKRGLP